MFLTFEEVDARFYSYMKNHSDSMASNMLYKISQVKEHFSVNLDSELDIAIKL